MRLERRLDTDRERSCAPVQSKLRVVATETQDDFRARVLVERDKLGSKDRSAPVGTAFYLHSQGKANSVEGNGLLSHTPPGDELADHYTYDPAKPTRAPVDTRSPSA